MGADKRLPIHLVLVVRESTSDSRRTRLLLRCRCVIKAYGEIYQRGIVEVILACDPDAVAACLCAFPVHATPPGWRYLSSPHDQPTLTDNFWLRRGTNNARSTIQMNLISDNFRGAHPYTRFYANI